MPAAGATAASTYKIVLTAAEINYYATMKELGEHPCEVALVGAGLGDGFANKQELHVMNYGQAMKSKDKMNWEGGVKEEHQRMVKHKVWEAIPCEDMQQGNKIPTSTWAMKKKVDGTYHARLNARAYEQISGKHYDATSIAATVTSDMTICIVLMLLLMVSWYGKLLDVKGSFLHGEFEEG
jgi:hypothetical protein